MRPEAISRDPELVERTLQACADLYYSPTFCISYRKDKTNCQEFYTINDKDKCYARVRELRCKPNIHYLTLDFHFDLEVSKI